jgi:hypothetical protein
MFEDFDLSDVHEKAVVERDDPTFCTVYLLGGKTTDNPVGAPKVIGLAQEMKDDYTLKEEAYMVYMGRIEIDGVAIVKKS